MRSEERIHFTYREEQRTHRNVRRQGARHFGTPPLDLHNDVLTIALNAPVGKPQARYHWFAANLRI